MNQDTKDLSAIENVPAQVLDQVVVRDVFVCKPIRILVIM